MTSRTITTDAIGRCKAVPDFASVKAVAIGDGDSANSARVVAKDRASALRESVSNISANQIRTVDFQVKSTDEMFDSIADAPYQATERLQIDCVPENVETVVADLTEAGGRIRNVQFQLHKDKRRELQDEALNAAMERARKKADQMAASEGYVVNGVREATTKEVSTGMESIVDEALASSPDKDLYPGPITVAEAVEVVYELVEE